MRRPTTIELMLLGTIGLWALNLSVTRYVLLHGFLPLSYAAVRYGLAAAVFVVMGLLAERSLRLHRADLLLALAAALALYANQVGFVYALEGTSASVIGLILASMPIFAALIGLARGTEQLHSRFWLGVTLSFSGVAVVALGTGGAVEGDLQGIAFGILTAVTWAVYSVLVTPLMQRYSATRISAVVLLAAWVPITLTGLPQVAEQQWELGWEVWTLVLFATLGPLVLTNVLWFRSLDRIGPARATLATNLQPFLAALFAVVLLDEPLDAVLLVGGILIAAGILVARRRTPVVPAD